MIPNMLQVDLLQLASNYTYSQQVFNIVPQTNSAEYIAYDPCFVNLLGPDVSATITDERTDGSQFVHEAGIYLSSTDSIYVASQYDSCQNSINITVLCAQTYKATAEMQYPGQVMPNGGTAYNSTHALFCDFGNLDSPSQLSFLDPATNVTTPILTSFYGRNFSSINDVRVNHTSTGGDGSIYFSDSAYGALQGFRPPSDIPSQVYRFDPATGAVAAVADGFVEANGVEFSADAKTVYVSDTGYVLEPDNKNGTRPSTIYAYDVGIGGVLVNKRVFAYSGHQFPDGIHVDTKGNVWSSTGKGISAWNADGVLLGEIRLDTEIGVNNFMFVPEGILVFAFTKVWLIKCDVRGRAGG